MQQFTDLVYTLIGHIDVGDGRRPTEILPSTYCSHWLNRSCCVVLTRLHCSFWSLPSETSWIWIDRRLASSINNGAMVYNPLFPLPNDCTCRQMACPQWKEHPFMVAFGIKLWTAFHTPCSKSTTNSLTAGCLGSSLMIFFSTWKKYRQLSTWNATNVTQSN